jgi:penicillin-binding protein 1A
MMTANPIIEAELKRVTCVQAQVETREVEPDCQGSLGGARASSPGIAVLKQTDNQHQSHLRQELEFPQKAKRSGVKKGVDLLVVAAVLFCAVLIGLLCVREELHIGTVVLPTLETAKQGVQFYDRFDQYLCTVHADRDRQIVPLTEISNNVRMAVIATEDHRFYSHHGIDLVGLVRAFNKNQKAGHIVEGGSTITQQLVRALYLDKNDRSYNRKIKEVFLSADTENRYSKPKILETYLNEIYFGDGVYGIERAANNYFNKHASQLSIPESAFLAGLIKSPSVLGNPGNRSLAIARQHEVLDKMAEYGYVSKSEAAELKAQKLNFQRGENPLKYPYYITYALQAVHRELGDDMWNQNIKVYTNLDPEAQKSAVATLNKGIKSAPRGVNQGALVSMSVVDGAVLAMVGGVGEYQDNQWNRALFPHTAGSAFKPFVYLTGLTRGVLEPDSLIDDAPVSVSTPPNRTWAPKNFDGQFKGWMTVRDALAFSRNVCAVRVALETGIDPIIETAQAAGIHAKLDSYPSLALGACAVSPLEMATAYSTLARNGDYMPPQVIRAIETGGKGLRKYPGSISKNLPAVAVAQLVDVMQDVVRKGTGTQARLPGIAVAGKTGTADQARDIWFCGFTPDTVTVVWGGSDKNKAISGNNVTGGTVMAHIWQQYMSSYYAKRKPLSLAFTAPETPLAAVIPKYDDLTLLTTDVTKEDVCAYDSTVMAPNGRLVVNAEQVAANIPTILYNANLAAQKGIGKAFVLQGADAVRRWQASQYEPASYEQPDREAMTPEDQSSQLTCSISR